jgi:hypothetical protein
MHRSIPPSLFSPSELCCAFSKKTVCFLPRHFLSFYFYFIRNEQYQQQYKPSVSMPTLGSNAFHRSFVSSFLFILSNITPFDSEYCSKNFFVLLSNSVVIRAIFTDNNKNVNVSLLSELLLPVLQSLFFI